jgi:hypothetical protein
MVSPLLFLPSSLCSKQGKIRDSCISVARQENLKSLGVKSHFEIDTSQRKMERWNIGRMGNTAGTLLIGGFDPPMIPSFQYSSFSRGG